MRKINFKKLAKVLKKGVLTKFIPGIVISKEIVDIIKEQEERKRDGNKNAFSNKVSPDS